MNESLNVVIEYEYDDDPYSASFKCWEIVGHSEDEVTKEFTVPLFQDKENENVDDYHNAENYIRGMVKWDGCSHYYFGDPENSGYLHLCGKDYIEQLQKIVKHIYKKCGVFMTDHKDNDEFNF